ncbi:FRG domain-containing protein [Sphingomonas abietis]|uniref:FRG domain-containing protein n=1 Tax=Sphingomonas abietis TaxID=3012344 RepID=A0ABY7NRA3_9SPHN|nr:FRG domain-containing protein [Sphingomonas abietis]WBO23077.1 FRG domain-containing protein [Sphingomonas abietis]
MVDIDRREGYLSGAGVVFDDAGLPGSIVKFQTKDCAGEQSFQDLPITPIDPLTGNIVDLEYLKQRYADRGEELFFPSKAAVDLKLDGDELEVNWTTDIGSAGLAKLPRSRAASPSAVVPQAGVTDWGTFKAAVTALERGRFIFRGQPSVWRLQTAFHRTKRKDVFRFMVEDIPRLHQRLSGLTAHFFNLTDNQQNGAFWNLVQHHGYPTPLLDWSNSPFVAAFFAYRNKLQDDEDAPRVRIYAFDRQEWCKDFSQLAKIAPAFPHFSILECLALENPRLVPQQALSSITNVDDIESYIKQREAEKEKVYLTAYDLPASDVDAVLGELGVMGIAAGALFPGLDGACEEWKYRNFGFR